MHSDWEVRSKNVCRWHDIIYIHKTLNEVTQSCPTLCDPIDGSLPGSSVHGIFQARVLEWVAISFSREFSQPRDQTRVSHTVSRRFTVWTTREADSTKKYCGTNNLSKVAGYKISIKKAVVLTTLLFHNMEVVCQYEIGILLFMNPKKGKKKASDIHFWEIKFWVYWSTQMNV